ncbi:Hsp33 family molecular chaperone [Skermanella sp. TT6]|uniref:Hsp33 family molecular chaperone n=1 Tax=Skermanella cutis TaxID=2775420 RepID=A0ABX7B2T2_9PROT|nr:Hsp33 family molecular chaperone [Skermanella sp. TT6]QQP88629.1 Hsp33 family molecular chaperone [Skermanella sp. TT6]
MSHFGHAENPLTDDIVQPFQIDASHLRGRLVKVGPMLDEVLSKHAYPEPVAHLLGETITLAITLAGALKYEGIFTLQTKGDGPISLMVADVTSTGDVRGYAQFDAERLAGADAGATAPVPALLGTGYLAFTVDQGEHTERYQGIVELNGDTLSDCVQHYFRQSEQLDTGIKVAVGHAGTDSDRIWRGGALMLQRLPEDQIQQVLGSDVADDWRRAMVLIGTCTDAELLDPGLPPNDLLFRLFHEDGVRVYTPTELRATCRCSRDRVATVLRSLPREEISELKVNGRVEVTCEFCNSTYTFDDAQLENVYG